VTRCCLTGGAVTEHDTLDGAMALRNMQPPFEVIVGCEFTLSDGVHLIGLFLNAPIQATTFAETAAAIHAQGGIVIVPHPYREWTGLLGGPHPPDVSPDLMEQIDCIEVFNAKSNHEENERAMQLAQSWNKPVTAGSDAHRAARIGQGMIEAVGPLTRNLLTVNTPSVRGIDLTTDDSRRQRARRERIRKLVVRFKPLVPANIWREGKRVWETLCDSIDRADGNAMRVYGSFTGNKSQTIEQSHATFRKE